MSSPSLLSAVEARVLGCLLEKEITTPDYYPMTLNSLVAACNQRSNRDPVTEWTEAVVEAGLDGLRRQRLAVMIHMAGSRVAKYRHSLQAVYGSLDPAMIAVLCELLVRNSQTPGELRTRTERLHSIQDLAGMEETIKRMVEYGAGPLVAVLPPGGGRRVRTVIHLLSDPPADSGRASEPPAEIEMPAPAPEWKEKMEKDVAALTAEVAELRRLVDQLRPLLE